MVQKSFWFFEEVDLYNYLCPHKFKDLNASCPHQFHNFKKNDFIYLQEDNARHVFLVAGGKVKIGAYSDNGEETIKTILSKGDLFGELALIGEDKRTDFAQSLDDKTTICMLPVESMQELIKDHKTLSLKIFKLMGARIKKLERKIESLVFKDSRSRIIEFLKDMAEEKGVKVGTETMIRSNLTHKDIAMLTATSRQTVTTTFNELRNQNLINFNRKQILIRDLAKL